MKDHRSAAEQYSAYQNLSVGNHELAVTTYQKNNKLAYINWWEPDWGVGDYIDNWY